jgi:hypothetical protein
LVIAAQKVIWILFSMHSHLATNFSKSNSSHNSLGQHFASTRQTTTVIMADEEDIAALVIDNGSGMCKGELTVAGAF